MTGSPTVASRRTAAGTTDSVPAGHATGPTAPPDRRWRPYAAAGGAYLALAVVLWWHVWTAAAGPSSVMTCACTDAGRGMWYVEWSAWAITHGHGLFHSTLLFHPSGFNVLTDTSIQAIGVVMTPVTLLFGPVAAFNLAATRTPGPGRGTGSPPPPTGGGGTRWPAVRTWRCRWSCGGTSGRPPPAPRR